MRLAATLARPRGRGALPRRPPVGQVTSLPAPTDGWDASTPLSQMSVTRARILTNYWPEPDKVSHRKGYASHATGIGGDVEALMAYSDTTLFAAGEGTIWDVTSAGAAVSAVGGHASNRWQHANFATTGSLYLVCVNGTDDLRRFDGTNWSAGTYAGTATSTLVNVGVSKEHLWFAQNDSPDAWYLSAGQVQGTLVRFPLGGVFDRGGNLQAIGNWTVDGGAGIEDLTCFFSTLGEVAIYRGYDPASSTTWELAGVYRIGRPLGRRCLTNLGGELAVLTEFGLQPLSSAVIQDLAQQQAQAVTQRVGPAIAEFARLYSTNFGWQALSYPKLGALLINVPFSGTRYDQCAMNLRHGAWTRFTDIPAVCWTVWNGGLYFGDPDGTVFLADSGYSDNGESILFDVQTADTDLGTTVIKTALNVRMILATDGSPAPTMEIAPDFQESVPAAVSASSETDYGIWDTALWDTALWGPDRVTVGGWQGAQALGNTFSLRARESAMGFAVDWIRWDLRWQPGTGMANV